MSAQYDFKKEWEAAKKQILKFSKEAAKLTKKGEQEIIKFSKISKLHIDATTLGIKKEKLYYLIGKEYIMSKDPAKSAKLTKMVADLKALEEGRKSIQFKLDAKAKKTKASASKKAQTTKPKKKTKAKKTIKTATSVKTADENVVE